MADLKKKQEIRQGLLRFKLDLLKYEPIYGNLLMRMEVRANEIVQTAATDGVRIFYNPDYFAGLTEAERNYVLMHELFHVLYMHWDDQEGKDPRIWNVACDYAMKEDLHWRMLDLSRTRITMTPPKEFAYMREKYDGKTEEVYYRALLKENLGRFFMPLTAYNVPIEHVPNDLELTRKMTPQKRAEVKKELRKLVREVLMRSSAEKMRLPMVFREFLDQDVTIMPLSREEEALADQVSFLHEVQAVSDLSPEQRMTAENAIFSTFRLEKPEQVILGLQKLLDLNRVVVKTLLLEKDDPEVDRFVQDNFYALRGDVFEI